MTDNMTLMAVENGPTTLLTGPKALWSTARVLKETGVSRVTLWHWRRERDFPAPAAQMGNAQFWNPTDVRAWLDENRKGVGK